MNNSYLLGSGVIAAVVVFSGTANAQVQDATLHDALQQALAARREADEALKMANEAKARADEALRKAQALINRSHAVAPPEFGAGEATGGAALALVPQHSQSGSDAADSRSEVSGLGRCDIEPALNGTAIVNAATQYCSNSALARERAYGLNDLAQDLGLKTYKDFSKKSAPVFSLSTAKEGDYSGLGFNSRFRNYAAFNNNTYRSSLWSITPQVMVRVDKNKIPTLREYNAKDDSTAWSSNLSMKLDVRRIWGYRYDLVDAQDKLKSKLKALIDKCKYKDGGPCTDPSDLAGVDGAKDAYWDAVAPLWGLDKDGLDLPAQYYLGAQLQKGWNEVAYRPYFDPTTGTTVLPTNPSDVAGDEIKMKQHPLRFKLYGGAARRFSLAKDAKNTPGDSGKYFVFGAAGSVGWRRAYGLPEGTVDQDLCYPDAANVGYTKCVKSNTAKPYRSEGFTVGASLNLMFADVPLIGRPWLSGGYERDFDLKQDIWSVPVTLAMDGEGKLRGGMKWKWTGTGTTPDGTRIKPGHSVIFTLEQAFDWPTVP